MSEFVDIAITRKAIKEDWPVTNAQRTRAVASMLDILSNRELEPKLHISAIKTLVMMDGINVRREEIEVKKQPKHVIHHKELSTDELKAKISQFLSRMGLSGVNPAALSSLKQNLLEQKNVQE